MVYIHMQCRGLDEGSVLFCYYAMGLPSCVINLFPPNFSMMAVLGHGHSHGGGGHGHSHGGGGGHGHKEHHGDDHHGHSHGHDQHGHDHHGDDHHGHDHHDDDHHGHDHHGHSHGGGGNQVININADEEDIEVKMSSVKKLAQNINVRAAFIHVIGDLIQSVGVVIAGYIIKFEVNHSELCPCVCCSFNPGATEFTCI